MDEYLIQADKTLCHTGCPCGLEITNSTVLTSYKDYTPYMTDYIIYPGEATTFEKCPNASKFIAYEEAIKKDPKLDAEQTFNAVGFSKAFAWVESTFKCTGWCKTEYTASNGVTKIPLFKYLYNDINK